MKYLLATTTVLVCQSVRGEIAASRSLRRGLKDKFDFPPEDSEDGKSSVALEFLRDGLDPELFEWINKDEIVPGGTTCGWLHAPLGSDPSHTYPVVDVYVCVRFAEQQPAPNGFLFMHAGGPGSLSDDGLWVPLANSTKELFNLVSIDQRGMGRSEPNFMIDECTVGDVYRHENGTISSIDPPNVGIDTENLRETLPTFLEKKKATVAECWSQPQFHLEATQADGTEKTFHWLQHSGTEALAQDMNRIRTAFNANKLSCYGVSYGTWVCTFYATIFKDKVDKLVFDSSMPGTTDMLEFSESLARWSDHVYSYFRYSCFARNLMEPGVCDTSIWDPMMDCINDIINTATYFSFVGRVNSLVPTLYELASDGDEIYTEICELASDSEIEKLDEKLDSIRMPEMQFPPFEPTESGPTSMLIHFKYVVEGFTSFAAVVPQDTYGHSLSDEDFITWTEEMQRLYNGGGGGAGARAFSQWYVLAFYWPTVTGSPALGSPLQTGLIIGQTLDSSTTYFWTQDMAAVFPSMTMLSVQLNSHVLGYQALPDCNSFIDEYLAAGRTAYTDGTVCPLSIPEPDSWSFEGFKL